MRYLDKNVSILYGSKTEKVLIEKGLLKDIKIGNSRILMIEADSLYREVWQLLDRDIFFLLKEKPNL